MGICFIDTETMGLNPSKHAIWEVGLIDADGEEHQMMVELTEEELADADPFAEDIGGFHTRHPQGFLFKSAARSFPFSKGSVAAKVAKLTWGHHLVGAVPSFDEERLRLLLDSQEVPHRWHYHLLDVETLCVGFLRGIAYGGTAAANAVDLRLKPVLDFITPFKVPFTSDAISEAMGINSADFTKHEALSDARWAKALWDKVM